MEHSLDKNVKTKKMNLTKYFLLFFALATTSYLFSQNRRQEGIANQNVNDWRYDAICNGSGGSDSSYLIDISVYVSDIRLALETAKKASIHAVLFKTITGNNTGCAPKNALVGPDAESKNAQYFGDFFFNQAMYSKFSTVPTGVPQGVQALDGKGKSLRVDYVVSVNVDALRKQLESDGIIASLAVDENVRKPSITIMPDVNFLKRMGYVKRTSSGEEFADYMEAYKSNDIETAIAKLEDLLQRRGYTPKNAFKEMQGQKDDKAFNEVFSGAENGGEIEVSDLDKLLAIAKADIFWEFSWQVNQVGLDKKLNYTVRATDAYTKESFSTETGEGPASFSATMPELLTQAITDKMDAFLGKHQTHFKKIIDLGRAVKLSFRTADSSLRFDTLIEDEYGETELGDLIIGYVGANSVKTESGVANFETERTQTQMTLNNVRIPLEIVTKSRYGESIISNDAEKFIKALQADFRKNLNVDGTIINKGLGEAVFVIGGR